MCICIQNINKYMTCETKDNSMDNVYLISKIISYSTKNIKDMSNMYISNNWKDAIDNYTYDTWKRIVSEKLCINGVKKGNINIVEKCVTCMDIKQYKSHILCLAAEEGNILMVRYLLENNVNINEENDMNRTALHIATKKNNIEIVKILLEKGIDIQKEDCTNTNSIKLSLTYNNIDIFWLLANNYTKNYTDLNRKDSQGDTLLHYTILFKKYQISYFLIKKGADVNAKNNDLETPLIHAIYGAKCKYLTKLLLENGADVNVTTNYYDQTPLHYAAMIGNIDIGKLLFEYGADVNSMSVASKKSFGDHLCRTFQPLHIASQMGHIDFVKLLLQTKKVQLNLRCNDVGRTPLHYALRNGYYDIAKLLIKRGANTCMKSYLDDIGIGYKSYKNPQKTMKDFVENIKDKNEMIEKMGTK